MSDPELDAMQAIADAMQSLDQDARDRVVRWAAGRYSVTFTDLSRRVEPRVDPGRAGGSGTDRNEPAFTDFVDLLDAVTPKTDVERALTGAYWLQVIQGAQSWPSQSVNNLLKDTGNGIANVTSTLSKAQARKPALVRQVSKSGRTAQARKQYKLTTAGIALVRASASGEEYSADIEE